MTKKLKGKGLWPIAAYFVVVCWAIAWLEHIGQHPWWFVPAMITSGAAVIAVSIKLDFGG